MRKFLAFFVVLLLFSGCAKMYNSNEVSINELNKAYTFETGVVVSVKNVVVKDDGSGTFGGMYAGMVLGSLFGEGKGNILSTLLGTFTGAYVGNQLSKANAEELFIKLDSGKQIVTIVKGVKFHPGDKVRIIKNGYKIVRVEKI